jgi:hypothetical protein
VDEQRAAAEDLVALRTALLGYYLAGRRTDDELLGEVQAAWAEYEALTCGQAQRALEEGARRGRPEPGHEERVQAGARPLPPGVAALAGPAGSTCFVVRVGRAVTRDRRERPAAGRRVDA